MSPCSVLFGELKRRRLALVGPLLVILLESFLEASLVLTVFLKHADEVEPEPNWESDGVEITKFRTDISGVLLDVCNSSA